MLVTKVYTIRLPGSRRTVSAEITMSLIMDNNYGADIDGNRGMAAILVDAFGMMPVTHDSYGKKLSTKDAAIASELIERIALADNASSLFDDECVDTLDEYNQQMIGE